MCHDANNSLANSDSYIPSSLTILCCKSCAGMSSTLFRLKSQCLETFFYSKEYERAVIFRLGRLLTGGARGPGVFFIIPCVDVYEKIDMRSQTFEIPPQEVISVLTSLN